MGSGFRVYGFSGDWTSMVEAMVFHFFVGRKKKQQPVSTIAVATKTSQLAWPAFVM